MNKHFIRRQSQKTSEKYEQTGYQETESNAENSRYKE